MKKTLIKLSTLSLVLFSVVACSDPYISADDINLSETSIILAVDSSKTIIADLSPTDATDKAVTWSSNNPEVASVNNEGVVTANSIGTAEIVALSTDGIRETVIVKTLDMTAVELPPSFGLSGQHYSGITFDQSGNTWAGAGSYIYKISSEGNLLEEIKTPEADFITDMFFDSEESLWIANRYKGLLKYEEGTFTRYQLFNEANEQYRFDAMAIDGKDNLWLTLDDPTEIGQVNIAKFDGNDFQIIEIPDSLFFNVEFRQSNGIMVDKEDNIYYTAGSSRTFLLRYDGDNWTNLRQSGFNATDMTVDKDNNLWVAYRGVGLTRFNDNGFNDYGPSQIHQSVDDTWFLNIHFGSLHIMVDQNNVKWFGITSGLLRYDDNEWDYIDPTIFPDTFIHKSGIDAQGNLWFVSFNKVYKVEPWG